MGSSLLRRGLGSATRWVASALGYDMVPRGYFSPIPRLDELPDSIWSQPHSLPGVEFDTERQLAYLERDLRPFLQEFDSHSGPLSNGFRLDNVSYGPVDAEVLYAMVRRHRPKRMLEIGAGWSTLVSAAACAANAREGQPAELIAIDPHPGPMLLQPIEGLTRLERLRVQDMPLGLFDALRQNDILFIDTTHTVKVGGDVNRLILEILPNLSPGVLVHIHDVFLPWEYPREWLEQLSFFWSEQYLVQAFLSGNREWEVLLAVHHLVRAVPQRMEKVVRSFHPKAGGALWIRRTAA